MILVFFYLVTILCAMQSVGIHFSFVFFLFKHKTAYELRISDWSSDVCSSDLDGLDRRAHLHDARRHATGRDDAGAVQFEEEFLGDQIGRASCRERVCQYV